MRRVLGIILSGIAAAAQAKEVNPALPEIPEHHFKLTDFGAVGDGKTLNTAALDRAIAAVSAAGGGWLEVPAGTFLTLPFSLVSHLGLHLDEGATIKFPDELSAYGPAATRPATDEQRDASTTRPMALIGGQDITDVAITGSGTIDGSGAAWWHVGRGPKAVARPKLIVITNCRRLHFQGITLLNAPMWNLVPTLCADVTIEDLHVQAPSNSPNTDAVDPTASQNVLIRNCVLDVGDDNVAIKAIGGWCGNILVDHCQCKHGHGISIGSETYGGIQHVTVRNCTFDGTVNGIRIKSARDRGNVLGDFSFSNITMNGVSIAIDINLYYHDKDGSRNRTEQPVTKTTPTLSGVYIDHVSVTGAKTAGDIVGLPESTVKDVSLSDVQIGSAIGFTVQDASDVVFKNVVITPEQGEALKSNHAQVTWDK